MTASFPVLLTRQSSVYLSQYVTLMQQQMSRLHHAMVVEDGSRSPQTLSKTAIALEKRMSRYSLKEDGHGW